MDSFAKSNRRPVRTKKVISSAMVGLTLALLIGMTPVSAKGNGPIRVMAPSGEVQIIRGRAADTWWRHFSRIRCRTCGSPSEAAQLFGHIRTATSKDDRAVARPYLISPRYLQTSWPQASFFYESTSSSPPYLVIRGGVSNTSGTRVWDAWQRATRAMERVIESKFTEGDVQQRASGSTNNLPIDKRNTAETSSAPIILFLFLIIAIGFVVLGFLWYLLARRRATRGLAGSPVG